MNRYLVAFVLVVAGAVSAVLLYSSAPNSDVIEETPAPTNTKAKAVQLVIPKPNKGRNVVQPGPHPKPNGRFALWMTDVPSEHSNKGTQKSQFSNVRHRDYLGSPSQCGRCHEEQYAAWKNHAHRRMNQVADPTTVLGDFRNGQIHFEGGTGRFFQERGRYVMTVERGDLRRHYRVERTIGSRFFQYYVGVQLEGPEPKNNPRYSREQVLPFGYWLRKKQWVPLVHIYDVGGENADNVRKAPYEDFPYIDYDTECSDCHTTLALADWLYIFNWKPQWTAAHDYGMHVPSYIESEWPDYATGQLSPNDYHKVGQELSQTDLRDRAVDLGITCEACHYGNKAHAKDPTGIAPQFFPSSPLIHSLAATQNTDAYGPTKTNINMLCGRCHNSPRRSFPSGAGIWNSSEHRDAMMGHCYSELKCTHCHNPHQGIGKKWTPSPADDDAKCQECHQHYKSPESVQQHTHHKYDSPGSRCMNCHMPKITEGIDVETVRTHTIFSPTHKNVIEKGGPNACNLCHLDRSIDWTLKTINEWYGRKYDENAVNQTYPSRTDPMVNAWTEHPDPPMRQVAISAIMRQAIQHQALADWAMPLLVPLLNDPVMTTRQFAQSAIETLTQTSLTTQYSYIFYQTEEERRKPLSEIYKTYKKKAP